jgi:hypothetical protein
MHQLLGPVEDRLTLAAVRLGSLLAAMKPPTGSLMDIVRLAKTLVLGIAYVGVVDWR